MRPTPAAILGVVTACLLLLVLSGCGLTERTDRLSVQLTAPGRIDDLDLTELWGRVSQAVGVEADGASLEDLHLVWRDDGTLRQIDLRVITADDFFLQVGGTTPEASGLKLSAYGSRVEPGFQRSSWSTSLDRTLAVLDALRPRSIERFQRSLVKAEPGSLFGLGLGMRGQGGGDVGWGPRAFLFEDGRFVRLHPDDERRAFAPGTVVLVSSVLDPRSGDSTAATAGAAAEGGATATTEMYGTSGADALTYYLVPAEAWPPDLGDPGVAAPLPTSD